MKYYYPIILKNKRLSPFKISPEVELRRLTKRERAEFFGLRKVEFIFTHFFLGHLDLKRFVPSKGRSRCPYTNLIKRGLSDGSSDILASNYVLIMECKNSPDFLLDRLNLSFKLFKPTSTGGYIGFQENETDVGFHYYMPINGPFDYLQLNKKDLETIRKIFLLVEKNKEDKNFKLYSELYSRALLGGKTKTDIRFLLLVISLECLYMPEDGYGKKRKISARAASILCKFCKLGKSEENIKREIKEIYEIRGELVHNGESNKLNNLVFMELANYVRISLNLYLKDKNLFSEKYLITIKS